MTRGVVWADFGRVGDSLVGGVTVIVGNFLDFSGWGFVAEGDMNVSTKYIWGFSRVGLDSKYPLVVVEDAGGRGEFIFGKVSFAKWPFRGALWDNDGNIIVFEYDSGCPIDACGFVM